MGADFATEPGERRDDARAFIIALVAGLLGGVSDAIEQNNAALATAFARHRRPGKPGRRHADESPPVFVRAAHRPHAGQR
jgi:hypothetical protein